MASTLKEKDFCGVLVIEPASSIRQMISEIVKDFGYKNIFHVSSNKEALHVLEVEKIGWVISSGSKDSQPDSNVTIFHILKLISVTPRLKGTLVSLLTDGDQDPEEIVFAFEMGLFSYHQKSYVKDAVSDEFQILFNYLKEYQWQFTLTSAAYLRELLKERHKLKSLLALEENLLSMFPGSADILLHLAEAELLNGRKDTAASMLGQVEMLDKKLSLHCKKLKEKYLPSTEDSQMATAQTFNPLGLKRVVLIDADTDVLYYISELLGAVGVKQIEQFEDGASAFQWLEGEKKEPDLVIMEWRTFGISGPVLVQRIRQMGYLQVPIIVISSLIEKSDFPILKEMGVDHCQTKPFEQADFYASIVWAIQQNRCPTEQKSLQLKIRRLLHAEKIEEAKRLMAHFFTDDRINESSKLEIEAEYFFATGETKQARDKGIAAIKHGGDSLLMLNLVGKSMLKLKEFEGALRCFEKANSISSLNIERLLNLAHASIEVGNMAQAAAAAESAKNLDPTNLYVAEMECNVRIETGTPEQAQALMENIDSGKNIISYMNNRAVSLARNGRFEDSIDLYKKTIVSLPSKWKDLKALVTYNLGLAYARYGDLDLAKEILKEVSEQRIFEVAKKAGSLLKRVEVAVASGGKLELQEQKLPEPEKIEEKDPAQAEEQKNIEMDLLEEFEARKGDIACYLVFFYVEGDRSRFDELVKDLPRFLQRSSIEKT